MNGVVSGGPQIALAAHDVARIAAYLVTRPDVGRGPLACVGWRGGAVAAIAAGRYGPSIAGIAALDIGDTAAAGDVPQMAAALAPRPLWIQGAAHPEVFAGTQTAYGRGGLLITRPPVEDAELVAWVCAVLAPNREP